MGSSLTRYRYGLLLLLVLLLAVGVLPLLTPKTVRAPITETATATEETATQAVTDIALVPYETDQFASLRPRGWRAEDGGAFAYADTDIAIVQREIAAPGISFVQPGVQNDLNLIDPSGEYTMRRANGLDWRLYEGVNAQFTISYALAKGSDFLSVYFILMQSNEAEHATLRERVFLPVIDAFTQR